MNGVVRLIGGRVPAGRGLRRRIRVGGWALLFAAGTALGAAQPADPPAPSTTVLVVEKPDLGSMLVDPKDQALKRALAMLPARLHELPDDMGPDGAQLPLPLIDHAIDLLRRPMRLALVYNPANPAGGFMGAGLLLSFGVESEREAREVQQRSKLLLDAAQVPFPGAASRAFAGMTEFTLPFGTIRHGVRQTPSGWGYEVHAGSIGNPDEAFAALPDSVGEGLRGAVRARLDFAPLTPLMGLLQLAAGRNPEAIRALQEAQEAGLAGPDAMKVTFAAGTTGDRSRQVVELVGAGKARGEGAPAGGFLSRTPLTAAQINVVPADAHWGNMVSLDLAPLREMITGLATVEPDLGAALTQLRDATGVDLVKDVLGAIGGSGAVYTSDSTGGGGLLSMVAAIGVTDRAKLMAAHGKLVAFLNEQLAAETDGRVHVRRWTRDGVEFHSVVVRGVPIPVEPTYAVTDSWLIVGATPGAAIAGARQAMGTGGPGLMTNRNFTGGLPDGREFISVGFADAERCLRAGYPLLSLAGSAIANSVRSRVETDRDPGPIVPTFGELVAGARSDVSCAYWRGEDYVMERTGDRSVLVGAGIGAGKLMTAAPIFAAGGLAAAGERAKAEARVELERERAEDARRELEEMGEPGNDEEETAEDPDRVEMPGGRGAGAMSAGR